jgi:hypothetical protein
MVCSRESDVFIGKNNHWLWAMSKIQKISNRYPDWQRFAA